MKKKTFLLALIPMLVGCNTGSAIKKHFDNAYDLGSFDKRMISYEKNDAKFKVTDYYKFTLTADITFDVEDGDALSIVAYDTKDHYEDFSMKIDVKLYNSSFKEIELITLREYCEKYEDIGDSGQRDENAGKGAFYAECNVEAGDYYFSLTPLENVFESHYLVWVAPYIGD